MLANLKNCLSKYLHSCMPTADGLTSLSCVITYDFLAYIQCIQLHLSIYIMYKSKLLAFKDNIVSFHRKRRNSKQDFFYYLMEKNEYE